MIDPAATLFTTPIMTDIFSARAQVERMLGFEAALARALVRAELIPEDAAQSIEAACADIDAFDVDVIFREAAPAGTPAIPLVRMLTERVPEEARRYVHLGATSQDVIDTAMADGMQWGVENVIGDLIELGDLCAALANRHRRTPMAGRTLLQQASPITFGLKAARWLGLVTRSIERLGTQRYRVGVIQLGGASGNLAALGISGLRVAELLADERGHELPVLPWHTERDLIAETAGILAIVAGSMGKIAQDIVLLAQTEVGEVSEGSAPGKGGSSTLPHKQNPVDATFALAAAKLALGTAPVLFQTMLQEHERSVGAWQAEWSAIPTLFGSTHCAVQRTLSAVSGLVVHEERMRANLDLGRGLLMAEALSSALTPSVGRDAAQRIVKRVSGEVVAAGTTLREAALSDAEVRAALSEDSIESALDPLNYLGSNDALIDRAIAAFERARGA
jgi:3-carboxy-cis,cis-muconate cycloisomerase